MTETLIPLEHAANNLPKVLKTAQSGPVIITVDGRPTHVVMTIDRYQDLSAGNQTLAKLFYYPGAEEIEFEPEKLDIEPKTQDRE
jgi:prevent-host-death family protein